MISAWSNPEYRDYIVFSSIVTLPTTAFIVYSSLSVMAASAAAH